LDRFKNRPSENRHVFFDDDGNVVAPPVVEKAKEFLESEKNAGSGEDEEEEEFLTADELRTEEDDDDFHDTHQHDSSVEIVQVQTFDPHSSNNLFFNRYIKYSEINRKIFRTLILIIFLHFSF